MNREELQAYLDKELSNKEAFLLEKQTLDSAFETEAMDGFELVEKEKIPSILNELDAKIDNKTNTNFQTKPKSNFAVYSIVKYSIAASLIFGILFFSYQLINKKTNTTQNIYASYYKPLTHPDGAVRGETNEPKVDISNEEYAVAKYEAEDYTAAVKYYEEIVKINPNDAKQILFLSISYLSINEPKKAIGTLAKYKPSNSAYDNDIQWYLALAYLKNEEVNTAKLLFENLSTKENFYQNQATEIVAALEKK